MSRSSRTCSDCHPQQFGKNSYGLDLHWRCLLCRCTRQNQRVLHYNVELFGQNLCFITTNKSTFWALQKFPKRNLPKQKFPNESFPKWKFPKYESTKTFCPCSILLSYFIIWWSPWIYNLEQWFPTGVPQHTRVPQRGVRGAVKFGSTAFLGRALFSDVLLQKVPPNYHF